MLMLGDWLHRGPAWVFREGVIGNRDVWFTLAALGEPKNIAEVLFFSFRYGEESVRAFEKEFGISLAQFNNLAEDVYKELDLEKERAEGRIKNDGPKTKAELLALILYLELLQEQQKSLGKRPSHLIKVPREYRVDIEGNVKNVFNRIRQQILASPKANELLNKILSNDLYRIVQPDQDIEGPQKQPRILLMHTLLPFTTDGHPITITGRTGFEAVKYAQTMWEELRELRRRGIKNVQDQKRLKELISFVDQYMAYGINSVVYARNENRIGEYFRGESELDNPVYALLGIKGKFEITRTVKENLKIYLGKHNIEYTDSDFDDPEVLKRKVLEALIDDASTNLGDGETIDMMVSSHVDLPGKPYAIADSRAIILNPEFVKKDGGNRPTDEGIALVIRPNGQVLLIKMNSTKELLERGNIREVAGKWIGLKDVLYYGLEIPWEDIESYPQIKESLIKILKLVGIMQEDSIHPVNMAEIKTDIETLCSTDKITQIDSRLIELLRKEFESEKGKAGASEALVALAMLENEIRDYPIRILTRAYVEKHIVQQKSPVSIPGSLIAAGVSMGISVIGIGIAIGLATIGLPILLAGAIGVLSGLPSLGAGLFYSSQAIIIAIARNGWIRGPDRLIKEFEDAIDDPASRDSAYVKDNILYVNKALMKHIPFRLQKSILKHEKTHLEGYVGIKGEVRAYARQVLRIKAFLILWSGWHPEAVYLLGIDDVTSFLNKRNVAYPWVIFHTYMYSAVAHLINLPTLAGMVVIGLFLGWGYSLALIGILSLIFPVSGAIIGFDTYIKMNRKSISKDTGSRVEDKAPGISKQELLKGTIGKLVTRQAADLPDARAMIAGAVIEENAGFGDPAAKVGLTIGKDGSIVKGEKKLYLHGALFDELAGEYAQAPGEDNIYGHIITGILKQEYRHYSNNLGKDELNMLANLKASYEKASAENPDSNETKRLARALAAVQIYYEMQGYGELYNYLRENNISAEDINRLSEEALQKDKVLLASMLKQLGIFMETWPREGQKALAAANDLKEGKGYIADSIKIALSDGDFAGDYLRTDVTEINNVRAYIQSLGVNLDTANPERDTELNFSPSLSPRMIELENIQAPRRELMQSASTKDYGKSAKSFLFSSFKKTFSSMERA